jgi:glutaredoxin 3
MTPVLKYAKAACNYCKQAEKLLLEQGASIEKVRVDLYPARLVEMTSLTGKHTVPQIFVKGIHIGGNAELVKLEQSGELAQMFRQP